MDMVKLAGRTRTGSGKSYTVKARAAGWVPAICYGQGETPLSIEVDGREFGRIVRTKQAGHLIELSIEGTDSPAAAVVKEIQHDVLRPGHFMHVDFQRVAMDEAITVTVPVMIEGTPVAVKTEGGILEHPVREVTVKCLPGDIPDRIAVDVTNLGVGEAIHVSDLNVPNAEIQNAPAEVVATVTLPAKEVSLEGEAAAGEGAEEEAGGGAATQEKE